ncbi:MAG TPA: GH116 family glycosyl hydrolase [Gemmatimonadales bacterium]|nr:GH116 family glycosyl hydrolase [Gemmatimonadales bacterium]
MRRISLLAVGAPGDAAWGFLQTLTAAAPRRFALDEIPRAIAASDVLWIHTEDEPPPLPAGVLREWLTQGGRLLLTQRATARVASLGLDPDGPNDVTERRWSHDADELFPAELRDHGSSPHVRGLAAYGPHPLFTGMAQGTYVWAPQEGERYVQATYARGKRPTNGSVVAVERAYIQLNADRVIAWEYGLGLGGVLCLGAFVVLHAKDLRLERQLHAVLRNALVGNGIPHHTRPSSGSGVTHWPIPGTTCRLDSTLVIPDPVSLDGALPGLDSPLHVSSRALSDEAFTVAGRRTLVVGGEQTGVREIWMHPYRVARDFAVTVGGEAPLIRDVQITPILLQRHLVSRARITEEAVTTALDHPIALLDFRPEKIGRARGLRIAPELALAWQVDLRRMWPYGAGCGGDLRYALAPDRCRLFVTDSVGSAHVLFQTSAPVSWTVRPADAGTILSCALRTQLDEPLRMAVVGGISAEDFQATLGALERRGINGIAGQRARHETQLREYQLRLRAPEDELNIASEWAKQRLDACFVDTPGIGRSLVAGYAASRPGWGDGRPGYAWYFGRDACWSALALLAVGDFAGARLVLRFLGETQDVSGKVIHEYTTSGLAHYDAADATPLYLLLAGRYAAWTGDLAFLEERWSQIDRAYRYCLETDRDDDGLIENTGVGHGWIEMGPLSGAHVSLYLAAIWAAALESLAPIARALGRVGEADDLTGRAERARREIGQRFRTDEGWALGLLADGTPQRHQTALTSVALLLGAVDPATAAPWFDAMASDAFSAPWGVRLLSRRDRLYNPAGYHLGSVWPLYTGWVSLAEYAGHRPAQGLRHLRANGRLPFVRAHGAFDEVLNGEVEIPAGVCPDQAWSAALFLLPVVEGLLGAKPDALQRQLTLAPHLPPDWAECEWRGLHVGATVMDVRVVQAPDRLVLRLRRTAGPRLAVTVSPALPVGRVAVDAMVDDHPLVPRLVERLGCRHGEVSLEVSEEHDVTVWHQPTS